MVAWHPELFKTLGNAAQRDLRVTAVAERTRRCLDLRLAAVDHQQLRTVGEPGAAARGAHLTVVRGIRVPFALSIRLAVAAGDGICVEVSEAAHEHLIHRVGVVGGLGDVERPVLVFARQPVFEDDHGGHDVGAAEMRDVEALDA